MENVLISVLAVILSVLAILSAMKLVKFVWNKLIKNPIIWILNFFKPELKNLYDFAKWTIKIFKSNKANA